MQIRVKEDSKEFGNCGCGRSPTGKCIGWHGLNDEQLTEAKRLWELEEYKKQAQELWNDSCTSPRSNEIESEGGLID
jgi:hypothetical protein